jgi:hypothetical protein
VTAPDACSVTFPCIKPRKHDGPCIPWTGPPAAAPIEAAQPDVFDGGDALANAYRVALAGEQAIVRGTLGFGDVVLRRTDHPSETDSSCPADCGGCEMDRVAPLPAAPKIVTALDAVTRCIEIVDHSAIYDEDRRERLAFDFAREILKVLRPHRDTLKGGVSR